MRECHLENFGKGRSKLCRENTDYIVKLLIDVWIVLYSTSCKCSKMEFCIDELPFGRKKILLRETIRDSRDEEGKYKMAAFCL